MFMKLQLTTLIPTVAAFIFGGCASSENPMDFSPHNPIGFPPLQMATNIPEHITLRSFGQDGQQFAGFLIVDNVRREISGVTPAEYQFDCVVLSGYLTNKSSVEDIGFVVSRPNGHEISLGNTNKARWFRHHAGRLEIIPVP
jgi:hypothetical protein